MTEQPLDQLASADGLKQFRYLHFATHGLLDSRNLWHSALVLAQDQLPDAVEQAVAGREVYDGRITPEQIIRSWKLDADLVTLSACQSGIAAKHSGGEGYLGFSQALFVKGARSLVLSLWKVDDDATALLMTRFYENLLGARSDLPRPLPKARALAEAKRWLRNLTSAEVDELVKKLPASERGEVVPLPKEAAAALRRFEHPYYWSGFILIGDPGDLTEPVAVAATGGDGPAAAGNERGPTLWIALLILAGGLLLGVSLLARRLRRGGRPPAGTTP